MSPTSSGANRWTHTKLYDLAAATPLLLLLGFGSAGLIILMSREVTTLQRDFVFAILLTIFSQLALLSFLLAQIILFVIRRLPIAKSYGLLPRAVALLGANIGMLVLVIPRADNNSLWMTALSATLIVTGSLASVWVCSFLKRCFSILPEARGLVMRGPYRYIRHPLYLAEQVAMLGVMLQYRLPWSAVIFVVSFAAQLPRMHFEEQVLGRAFQDYATYRKRTRRLIPGLY